MRNPTPGKNPFELGSYIDRFPLVFQWLYIDLNRDFFKLKGRTGVSRFWAMYIFSFIFLGIVYWTCHDSYRVFFASPYRLALRRDSLCFYWRQTPSRYG